jgi:hypothetical protein
MVIDTVNGFAYLGTYLGVVVKVRLSDLTRIGAVAVTNVPLFSAVADPNAGYAYFGTTGSTVRRLRLSDFTSDSGVDLGSIQKDLRSAAIDTVNGFAYFGTFTSPGRVAKINLTNFGSAESIALNAGEDYLISAVVDPANGFAYFGTLTQPGIVVKIDLAATTRIFSISGRVMNAQGRGVTNAVVTLRDPQNATRQVVTGRYGNYSFTGVLFGQSYSLSVSSRRFTFTPRNINVTSDLTGLDLVAQPY